MNREQSQALSAPTATDWLAGGGEMGKLIRSIDWSRTALGPIESWPQSLRTTVSLCLSSNFPISIAWGPGHVQIYNDGYWPICGGKHPNSMGEDFSECWASAWPAIGEAFASALAGEASYLENQRMFLDRNGYLEETFFTFSFSPIRDETGGVGGLFHPVTETTSRMLSERRTKALRDLAARTGKAQTTEEAFVAAAQTLSEYELDLPFVLLYTIDGDGKGARLAAGCGVPEGTAASPQKVELALSPGWALRKVVSLNLALQIDHFETEWMPVACGPYPEPPKTALSMPITPPGAERPAAVLVVGISPRLPFNEVYRGFCEQLAATLTAAVANARAHEEERKRAEMLAELDQAKTTFFSNISHEFRTPLMLMLGPLEEALADRALLPDQRQPLEIAHRNSLRLLKLVNILLDFSRIEAGRMQASYEPVDLALFTANLASVFRSAVEKAGIELTVECRELPEPVFVDREMWEKIVFNLVSNAFKFTEQGRISVELRVVDGRAELAVKDTGCGIPADQLDNVFKRFHRIEGTRGRTYEGSGIGLALVEELAKLHGGTVRVESAEGLGSTFFIAIPFGKEHLPAGRILPAGKDAPTQSRSDAYVEEALRWLPNLPQAATPVVAGKAHAAAGGENPRPRVLLADDNADMREYVHRILADHYEVRVVPDGKAALAAVQEEIPDLVLSDVMMPGLDGFGLLQELRAAPDTRTVPVIFLSARAGEESRVEGLEAGADDYLVKPFTARELQARVRSNLELNRARSEAVRSKEEALGAVKLYEAMRDSEERFRTLANAIPQLCWMATGDGWISWFNERWYEYTGTCAEEVEGLGWQSVLSPEVLPEVQERWRASIAAGNPFEMVLPLRGRDGISRPYLTRVRPLCNDEDGVVRWFGTNTDIAESKRIEEALRESEKRLALALEGGRMGLWEWDLRTDRSVWNVTEYQLLGLAAGAGTEATQHFFDRIHPEDLAPFNEILAEVLKNGSEFEHEHRIIRADDGEERWLAAIGRLFRDAAGHPLKMLGINFDITERKRGEESLKKVNEVLESRVVERTAALAASMQKLQIETSERILAVEALRKKEQMLIQQSRQAAMGEMISNIAHQWRQPLNSLGLTIQQLGLLYDIGEFDRDSLEQTISGSMAIIQHMSKTIDDFRNYFSPDKEKVEFKLSEALESTLSLIEDTLKSNNIAVEVVVEADPIICGYRNEFAQVLLNILNNANDAFSERKSADPKVTISLGTEDNRSVITIADNAGGVPEEIINKIFDPYFSTKGPQQGTGIGLYMSKTIIERNMGGKLTVENTRDGAGFRIEV